jgi:hypothetical protein
MKGIINVDTNQVKLIGAFVQKWRKNSEKQPSVGYWSETF